MSTLVYNPGVHARIESTVAGAIIDISEDIVSGNVTLRENAPHTAQFSLQNTQRKYDGLILPMDKITIQLKRLQWLQVMTGYVNDPPIFQAWPGVINFTATCTLKKPQFFYWDLTTEAAVQLIQKALGANAVNGSGSDGDAGLTTLVLDSMTQVLNWPSDQIHIGQIPSNWFAFAQKVSDRIGQDEAIYKTIGGAYTAAGTYSGSVWPLPLKSYAGYTVDQTQANNASIIYATVSSMTAIPAAQFEAVKIMTFMCAIDESQLKNLANPKVTGSEALPYDGVGHNGYSVGLFQQQPTEGWGPVSLCQNPAAATKTFVTRLLAKIKGNSATSEISSDFYGQIIQSVQNSGTGSKNDGSNYQHYLGPATEMVTTLDSIAKSGAKTQATLGGGNGSILAPAAGFYATGSRVASVALGLIEAHSTSPIAYHDSGDDPYTTPIDEVTTLDCSSLVDWVYYNATGKSLSGTTQRDTVATIRPRCKIISLDAAKEIQGAVLFNYSEHVAVSLGDGINEVAANTNQYPLAKQVNESAVRPGEFSDGGLLPGIDYSSSATTPKAKAALQAAGVKVVGYATTQITSGTTDPTSPGSIPGVQSGSPFQSLITNLVVNPDSPDLTGQEITGPATLINDQPFLPWLQGIVNSSMRSFCSAPNGDFIAWFPDYFGTWGTAGMVQIELVELMDFQVVWSDQQLVTHQFVIGNVGSASFDFSSGAIGSTADIDLIALAIGTAGIATLDFPEIFNTLYKVTAPKNFGRDFLERFGARPDSQQMPNIPKGPAEFFMALYLFTQRWASMFSANVPMTFMPELFPGMLLQIPTYGFQAYVQQVSHSFSFGPGGQFTTQATICAPSNIAGKNRADLLSLLPSGGPVS